MADERFKLTNEKLWASAIEEFKTLNTVSFVQELYHFASHILSREGVTLDSLINTLNQNNKESTTLLAYLVGVMQRVYTEGLLTDQQARDMITLLGINSAEDTKKVVPKGRRIESSTDWMGFYEMYQFLFDGVRFFPVEPDLE